MTAILSKLTSFHQIFVCVAAMLSVVSIRPIVAGNETIRPNILILFADDQRADSIGAYGNSDVVTPNIDGLVRRGFSFRNNYTFGSNSGAVCVPSRAMLMTSKIWMRIDTNKLDGETLLPEILKGHGYTTFGTGKWHNGEAAWLRGFQHGKSVFFGGMSDHTAVPIRDLGSDGQLTKPRTGEKFSSELFADAVIEFLDQHDQKKPFFAYTAFTAPHDPRQPPETFRDKYYAKSPALPKNFRPQLPFDNGMTKGVRDENLAPWPRTEAVIRDQLAEYYGLIQHLDEQIGRILAKLDEIGATKNTIIVYAADNGLALGSHGLLGKQNLYEHSMKVPLVFVGPNIPADKSTQALTYHLDILPTLLECAGLDAPKDIDGLSLRSVWKGEQAGVRDSVFLPFVNLQRSVRDDRWKLIVYPKIQHMELFDLENDPAELHDLFDDPHSQSHVTRLFELMKKWQTKVGDELKIPTQRKPLAPFDLTGTKRTPDQWQPEWIRKKYFD